MKIYLYCAFDKVANRPIDWFVSQNDGTAQRDATMIYSRQRPIKDIAYYRICELDSDDLSVCAPCKKPLLVAADAYKFPETVAVPVAEYDELVKVRRAFEEKIKDVKNSANRGDVLKTK